MGAGALDGPSPLLHPLNFQESRRTQEPTQEAVEGAEGGMDHVEEEVDVAPAPPLQAV